MLVDLPDNLAEALLAIAERITAARDGQFAPDAEREEPDEWLDEAGAAAIIDSDPERLRKHRREHTGPKFERFGRTLRFIRYRRSDVITWGKRNPGRSIGRGDIDDGGGEP